MASSTTNPVEIVSAISDRLSRLKLHRYITPNVPISEIGTATLGIRVDRTSRRKTNTTRTTSSTEMISVLSVSRTEARMVTVWSMPTRMSIDCGIAAFSCGNKSRTWSTVSMMLAPGCRNRMISTEGFPLA